MKLAIIGTRGIPNHYGGFEQLAEYLSVALVKKQHQVSVYCSSRHPVQSSEWKGVQLIHQWDPEGIIGTIGQFIYDAKCILHCRKQSYDVVLNLGYTSSSVWLWLIKNKMRIVTNMDGLEWKRSKYKKPVQKFLKFAEALAVKHSHSLVADSLGIQTYLQSVYNVPSAYIAYGTHVFKGLQSSVINNYGLTAYGYNMLMARMEPENNIELILNGLVNSKSSNPFIVIGNTQNQYGRYLIKMFSAEPRIRFLGPIYDINTVNHLRYYSNLYFHGHSVGGTNPSLLEAMGSHCLICAHDNIFNSAILQESAYYFKPELEVSRYLETLQKNQAAHQRMIEKNTERVTQAFSWDTIVNAYESVLNDKHETS